MTPVERRGPATDATRLHFAGRPFAWGRTDCVKVAAWHLRQLGYRSLGISKGGTYQTARSALAALRRAGFASPGDALDRLGLERIAPAAVLVGDIVALPGELGMQALAIVAGNGVVLSFHEDAAGLEAIRMIDVPLAAWRV